MSAPVKILQLDRPIRKIKQGLEVVLLAVVQVAEPHLAFVGLRQKAALDDLSHVGRIQRHLHAKTRHDLREVLRLKRRSVPYDSFHVLL